MAKGDLYWMGTNKMKARMHYQMDCHGRNTKYVILFLCTTSYIYIYCMNFPKTYLIQYKSTQLRKSSSHLGIILNHWLGDIQLRSPGTTCSRTTLLHFQSCFFFAAGMIPNWMTHTKLVNYLLHSLQLMLDSQCLYSFLLTLGNINHVIKRH